MIKKLTLTIFFCLIVSDCFSAELLIQARNHWMDNLSQSEIDKMSVNEKQSYDARSQIGDIIVVRPDGWVWGKEECLPRFVVVKLPNVSVDDVKYLEQSLTDTKDPQKPVMLKVRQYSIGATYTDIVKGLGGVASITKSVFDTKLIDKSK